MDYIWSVDSALKSLLESGELESSRDFISASVFSLIRNTSSLAPSDPVCGL